MECRRPGAGARRLAVRFWVALIVLAGLASFARCSLGSLSGLAFSREDAMPRAGESPATLPHDVLAWCRASCPRTPLVSGSHDGDVFDLTCSCPESLGWARVARGEP